MQVKRQCGFILIHLILKGNIPSPLVINEDYSQMSCQYSTGSQSNRLNVELPVPPTTFYKLKLFI
jgi:hypothetical protein